MIVCNTSPAIHLHSVLPKGLASLPSLLGSVVIPWEVGQELAAGKQKDPTWNEIQNMEEILLRPAPVKIHPLIRSQIDLGEAAVIQTALDEGLNTVVLDDLKARRVAIALGLSVTGTLGILIQAKLAHQLNSVSMAIAVLQRRGMWLAPHIVERALRMAGE